MGGPTTVGFSSQQRQESSDPQAPKGGISALPTCLGCLSVPCTPALNHISGYIYLHCILLPPSLFWRIPWNGHQEAHRESAQHLGQGFIGLVSPGPLSSDSQMGVLTKRDGPWVLHTRNVHLKCQKVLGRYGRVSSVVVKSLSGESISRT